MTALRETVRETGQPQRPSWPVMTLEQVRARLTAPGEPFEIETVTIRGVPTQVWKNALPNVRALIALSRNHGQGLATIYEEERVTYDAQHRAAAALAAHFVKRGIAKGDRVAIAMRNLPEWIIAFLATTALGAIAVPLNAWWKGEELAFGLSDSGARLLIADAERWERIAPHAPSLQALDSVLVSRMGTEPLAGAERLEDLIGVPLDWADLPNRPLPDADIVPDDDAAILYTSGTTGRPKGALATHRNFMTFIMSGGYGMARAFLRRGEALPGPRRRVALSVVPLFHTTGLSAGLLGPMAGGNTTIYMRKFEPLRAMEIIERERVNSTGGVPTIAWQLLEHPERHRFDLSSLESMAYGGAPSAPELVRRIAAELKVSPGNGWGMTETSAVVTINMAEDYLERPESCGAPVAVADLRIMDPEGGDEMPTGGIGELWVRGPMVVKGYWNLPEETTATFIDGWVRTGDLARLDDEGFCFIVDRAKDVIIRGGENIYSTEVENALYDHPAVTDCALVGVPHRTLGEEPAAVVHLAPGEQASELELQAWVRERLAAFKVPVSIVFVSATLPRNATGKIVKNGLKTLFEGRSRG